MKDSAKYAKIVEWSEEDRFYVGSAPGLILGGCHGDDEKQVFDELCQTVDEAIELYRADDRPLPPATGIVDYQQVDVAVGIWLSAAKPAPRHRTLGATSETPPLRNREEPLA